MGFKKIQMEPRGFPKMKLRFPSFAVYMENLRESLTNLRFADRVSKIRNLKIKVGVPEQLHYYTRPKSRRFYGPGFIFRHILGHFDPRIESSPCLWAHSIFKLRTKIVLVRARAHGRYSLRVMNLWFAQITSKWLHSQINSRAGLKGLKKWNTNFMAQSKRENKISNFAPIYLPKLWLSLCQLVKNPKFSFNWHDGFPSVHVVKNWKKKSVTIQTYPSKVLPIHYEIPPSLLLLLYRFRVNANIPSQWSLGTIKRKHDRRQQTNDTL